MARSFDSCVIDLTASGVDQEKARRACMAGFWAQNGMFPEAADQQGLELGGDCTDYAFFAVAEMSAEVVRHPVFFGGEVSEVKDAAKLEAFAFDTADKAEKDSLLVEAQMLAPGTLIDATGKEFTFTEDDMLAYRDNFNPLNQPPILLDHELSAKATIGRLRALRVDEAAGYVLMGLWEILGAENVKPVQDKRWSRTSGRFVQAKDRSQKVVIEGSIVWSGAYDRGFGDRAQILLGRQKGIETMSNPSKAAQTAPAQDSATVAKAADQANAPTIAELAAQVEALQAKLAERDKVAEEAAASPATLATSTEEAEPAKAVVAELSARIQQLETERAEEKKVARLQADANQVFDLVKAGKSTPEMHEQELAVLNGMPEALRPKYLELRQKLPNVWPTGNRQSQVVASAPGTAQGTPAAQKAEQDEFAELGADMGFAPQTAVAAKS